RRPRDSRGTRSRRSRSCCPRSSGAAVPSGTRHFTLGASRCLVLRCLPRTLGGLRRRAVVVGRRYDRRHRRAPSTATDPGEAPLPLFDPPYRLTRTVLELDRDLCDATGGAVLRLLLGRTGHGRAVEVVGLEPEPQRHGETEECNGLALKSRPEELALASGG